jgi:hypothetical protein
VRCQAWAVAEKKREARQVAAKQAWSQGRAVGWVAWRGCRAGSRPSRRRCEYTNDCSGSCVGARSRGWCCALRVQEKAKAKAKVGDGGRSWPTMDAHHD